MFTGLIESVGTISSRRMDGAAGKLRVKAAKPFDDLKHGDSIAVNGACLTLESFSTEGMMEFHVLEESFSRTNLGSLPVGGSVNLERAMSLGTRMGGHLVSGHIDATAKVISVSKSGSDIEITIGMPESLSPFFVEKGSVAVDGVSLTVASLSPSSFSVRIIPTTWDFTALPSRRKGTLVNIESDLIGKYVMRQMQWLKSGSESNSVSVSMDSLERAGF